MFSLKTVLVIVTLFTLSYGASYPLPVDATLEYDGVTSAVVDGNFTLPIFGVDLFFQVTGTYDNSTSDAAFSGTLWRNTTVLSGDGVEIALVGGSVINYRYVSTVLSGNISGPVSVSGVQIDNVVIDIPSDAADSNDYSIQIRDDSIDIDLDQFLDNAPADLAVKGLSINATAAKISYSFTLSLVVSTGSPLKTLAKYLNNTDIITISGEFNTSVPGFGQIETLEILDVTFENMTYYLDPLGLVIYAKIIVPHPFFKTDLVLNGHGFIYQDKITFQGEQVQSIGMAISGLSKLGIEDSTLSNVTVDLVATGDGIDGNITSVVRWRDICFNTLVDLPSSASGSLCDPSNPPTLQDIFDGLPAITMGGLTFTFDGNTPMFDYELDFSNNAILSSISDFTGLDLTYDMVSGITNGTIDPFSLLINITQITGSVWFADVVGSECSLDLNSNPPPFECFLSLLLPTFKNTLDIPFISELTSGDSFTLISENYEDQTLQSSLVDGSLTFRNTASSLKWDGTKFGGFIQSQVSSTAFGTEFCINFNSTVPTSSVDDVRFLDFCSNSASLGLFSIIIPIVALFF